LPVPPRLQQRYRGQTGATATFDEPNGIAASPDGRTLYVQQFGGALRTIAIEGD
jgi:sugar lactone lactonase YvrE